VFLLKSLDMGFNCHRHFLPVFAHIRPSYSPDVSGCNNPSLPRYFRFVEGEIFKKGKLPVSGYFVIGAKRRGHGDTSQRTGMRENGEVWECPIRSRLNLG
jgi:hypothetical protein